MALAAECDSFEWNCDIYRKLITLPWIHLKRNAVSTGLLLNLGTFMLQQPWCDFPNSRPKSFFVYDINSGIIHENTDFCAAAKQDYVLERTGTRCKTKCNAEPFALLACPSLVWLRWSLAVIQHHEIHTFCVLPPVRMHGDATTDLPLNNGFWTILELASSADNIGGYWGFPLSSCLWWLTFRVCQTRKLELTQVWVHAHSTSFLLKTWQELLHNVCRRT